jgi:hypothetical protein
MILKYLRIAALSIIATYLASLAAALFAPPAFNYFYSRPVRWFDLRHFAARVHQDIEEGVRQHLFFYGPQRDSGKGVVALNTGKTYGDYTFFFSAFSQKAYVIDLDGNVIHQWRLNAESLPPGPDAHNNPLFPDAVWRAFLQPNGDVIALYCGSDPWGRAYVAKGIFRVDKDSKLLWSHRDYNHHDVQILPGGNLLTFAEKMEYRAYPDAPSLHPPYTTDFLVTLNGRGEEIGRVSIMDMLDRSHLRKFIQALGTEALPVLRNGDLLHPNTITPVTAAAAARNPAFREGEYLLSFRNYDMLAVADLAKKRIVWASYGPWHGQHGPVFLSDGSLMMFDNQGNIGSYGGLSGVLDVDTATGEILWEYGDEYKDSVNSLLNSSVDPLPNGNVLVTETMTGRIFEVSHDKQIVWDYRAPQRLAANQGAYLIPNLFSGKRYRREDLPFLNGESTGAPIPEELVNP